MASSQAMMALAKSIGQLKDLGLIQPQQSIDALTNYLPVYEDLIPIFQKLVDTVIAAEIIKPNTFLTFSKYQAEAKSHIQYLQIELPTYVTLSAIVSLNTLVDFLARDVNGRILFVYQAKES